VFNCHYDIIASGWCGECRFCVFVCVRVGVVGMCGCLCIKHVTQVDLGTVTSRYASRGQKVSKSVLVSSDLISATLGPPKS